MSPLYLYNNKLLINDGKLAANENCCCSQCSLCINVSASARSDFIGDCNPPVTLKRRIVIPAKYKIKRINIVGGANDDLTLDGQSITTALGYDPGPYLDTADLNCVGAHVIGSKPGPFSDPINGGITIPWTKNEFEVGCLDTIGFGAGYTIRICINPPETVPLSPCPDNPSSGVEIIAVS